MKKMKRMMIALGMLLASTAVADRLVIQNVKIKNVEVFSYGGSSGIFIGGSNVMVRVLFEPTGTVNTGCAPTDTHHIVSYSGTSLNDSQKMQFALLLSAQAQSSNVDLYYDSVTCNTDASWNAYGTPYGLGRPLLGVRVISS